MRIDPQWPLGAAVVTVALFFSQVATAQAQAPATPPAPRTMKVASVTEEKFSGDFDKLLERRRIRVQVPYSRTLYFNDKGTQRGLTADPMREFEQHLNRKYGKTLRNRPITLIMVPTTRDEMFDDVAGGLADIAAGNPSITEARRAKADFATLPELPGMNEVIATGPKSPQLSSVDDLAGKTGHVHKSVSYRQTLEDLNRRFKQAGKPPMKLVDLPDALEDEDKLEMLGVGLLERVVIDDWKGRVWAQVLKDIRIRDDLVLKNDVRTGWAIRKDSPLLKAEIEEFMRSAAKTASASARINLAVSRARKFRNNATDAELKRFEQTLALFEKYGAKYGFDPLMLAAQGDQESQLRQDAKSHVGAIGIMQIMPATGAELKVGDITIAEPNIHGGAKYMDQLMTKFFPDAKFSESNRALFAFASDNAGPGRISQMRKEAAKRGLDPDKWFNSVEIVTAAKVGIETTTYVRNIYKYDVAYKLMEETRQAQAAARKLIEVQQQPAR